ncbi:MAG TPA: DmsE family decaheme c-type cytochrome [Terracidiphilus sp.]
MIESGEHVFYRKLKVAAMGNRRRPQIGFSPLFSMVLLCATAMAAQTDEAKPELPQAQQQDSIDSAAVCANCHKEIAKGFEDNPHSRARMPNGKSVTCESCHGSGKAHEQDGNAASIFNPSTAAAKAVDEKCQACHASGHINFENSSHGKGNVSCIGCHSIHAAEAPRHLLKLAQPELCYQCHTEFKAQFAMPFRHKVAEGVIQCTDCHDAHGDDRESPRHTSARQFDVCTKCHAAMAGPYVYQHAVIKTEGCTACHVPHGGANPKLLTHPNVNTICLQCHLPSLSTTTGKPSAPSHGNSAKGQLCTDCHSSIHGSNASRIFLNATLE